MLIVLQKFTLPNSIQGRIIYVYDLILPDIKSFYSPLNETALTFNRRNGAAFLITAYFVPQHFNLRNKAALSHFSFHMT